MRYWTQVILCTSCCIVALFGDHWLHCCCLVSVLTKSGRYEIKLDFVLDGVSYNVTHHDKCDLTSTGHEDTACMATLQAKYTAADESCYVDKRLLPECGAAGTTNTCVSYSGAEWDTGCWVCCLSVCTCMPQKLITLPSAACRVLFLHSHFILAFRLAFLLAEYWCYWVLSSFASSR